MPGEPLHQQGHLIWAGVATDVAPTPVGGVTVPCCPDPVWCQVLTLFVMTTVLKRTKYEHLWSQSKAHRIVAPYRPSRGGMSLYGP